MHADDEAFLRGRAAFETLRVYGGVPFRLESHLVRLAASCERIGIEPPDADECRELASLALGARRRAGRRASPLPHGRPRAGRRAAAARARERDPATHLEELRARGIRLVSLLGVRAEVPWLLGGVKSTSYAVNMAAEAEARARGADDAVFVTEDGLVLEGPGDEPLVAARLDALHAVARPRDPRRRHARHAARARAASTATTSREGRFPLADLRRRRGGVHVVVGARADAGRRAGRRADPARRGRRGAPGGASTTAALR